MRPFNQSIHSGSTKPQAPVFSTSAHIAWMTPIIVSILPFTLPVGTVCQHLGPQPRMTRTHRRLPMALANPADNWSRNTNYSLDSQLISAFICPSKNICRYFSYVHHRSNHIIHFNCPLRLLFLIAPKFASKWGFAESKFPSLSIRCCQFYP